MTKEVIEKVIGQSPCLCGDMNTWHGTCYAGKSNEQIAQESEKAYRTVAAALKQQAKDIAIAAIGAAKRSAA
jgi:hypothetical protein